MLMSCLSVRIVRNLKNGNLDALNKLKQEYEQAMRYIVLRKLKKERDVDECLDDLFNSFRSRIDEHDSAKMNVGTWFLLLAKEYADEYSRHSMKPVRKVTLENGIEIELPDIPEYEFNYDLDFGYSNHDLSLILDEEEYVILFFKTKYKLSTKIIGKLLELSDFSVNKFYCLALRKTSRYLIKKENFGYEEEPTKTNNKEIGRL